MFRSLARKSARLFGILRTESILPQFNHPKYELYRMAWTDAQQVRKSVSAECNWGIRLKEASEVKCYLYEILNQVLHRMSFLNLKARCITLKVQTTYTIP